jgi:hypothetical protein
MKAIQPSQCCPHTNKQLKQSTTQLATVHLVLTHHVSVRLIKAVAEAQLIAVASSELRWAIIQLPPFPMFHFQ